LDEVLTERYLRHQYTVRGRSLPDLAREHHTSASRIRAALDRHNIAVRDPLAPPVPAEITARITRDLLIDEYVNKRRAMKEIGADVGVSVKTIRKHLRAEGIPIRPQGTRRASLRDRLTDGLFRQLYVDEGLSIDEIADRFAVAPVTVGQLRARYGIPHQPRPRRGRHDDVLTEDYLTDAYLNRGLTLNEIATESGAPRTSVRSAIVGFGIALRSKGERPGRPGEKLTREHLVVEYLLNGRSAADIAAEIGVSKTSVLAALRREQINARTPAGAHDKALTKSFLLREYVDHGRSSGDIAAQVGCAPQTVLRRLDSFAIPRRAHTAPRPAPGSRTARLTKEFLSDEYVTNARSITSIAAQVGVSHPTVVNAMDRHGIERRPSRAARAREIQAALTKQYLTEQYVRNGRRAADIADELDISSANVIAALQRHQIEVRSERGPRQTLASVLTAEYLERRYVRDGATLAQIGAEMNTTASTVLRYARQHGTPIRPRTHRAQTETGGQLGR